MPPMHRLADEAQVSQWIDGLAEAIGQDVARSDGSGGWALVGIRSRGDVLAERLAQRVDQQAFGGRAGSLDITLYRDDLSEIGAQPIVRTTDIPFAVDGLNIVLVDDVLMTGRSIRAALQSLMDLGRPKRVWLCVLVDRGGRELPIAPDHVALDLSGQGLAPNEQVEVHLKPTDDCDEVVRTTQQATGERP
jgi:pyrimidine operon attenuation protein/uracil phosphoribosyltransferase